MKRKICLVTGSRAEYGLLKPLIDELKKSPAVTLQLIATGMHLSREFGLTYKAIEADGLRIDEKIRILNSSDTPLGISTAIGRGIISFAKAYHRLTPDIVVGLGDRFELFAALSAAMVSRLPIAHIHGGETTVGAMDEAMRHSITKMSHLHFTSTEEYRQRVIQLGENPRRVFNVGAIGIDNIKGLKLLSKNELERSLKFEIRKPTLIVTYHPVTLEHATSQHQVAALLEALDQFPDVRLIFTKPNADADSRIIIAMIHDYVKKNSRRAQVFTSLGQLKYLSALQYVDGVIGNSSSGIIEVPSFRIGTVNIGDRQKGRIGAASIIHCPPERAAIVRSLKQLFSPRFQKRLAAVRNPHGDGGAAKKIASRLISEPLNDIIKKEFFDLPPYEKKH